MKRKCSLWVGKCTISLVIYGVTSSGITKFLAIGSIRGGCLYGGGKPTLKRCGNRNFFSNLAGVCGATLDLLQNIFNYSFNQLMWYRILFFLLNLKTWCGSDWLFETKAPNRVTPQGLDQSSASTSSSTWRAALSQDVRWLEAAEQSFRRARQKVAIKPLKYRKII